jgi:hypothetical protein
MLYIKPLGCLMDKKQKINYSIERYIHTCWSLSDTDRIKNEFGTEILDEVSKIYSISTGYPVDWDSESMESISNKLKQDLSTQYPFLSQKAINNLANCFSYCWK